MKPLIIIPARGGSKGIPGKNIKPLGGKPLICHTIDAARGFADDERICVSTDDPAIAEVAENYGLKVPFLRPEYLASDTASTYDVLLHAVDFYERAGLDFDTVVLLQPTSPFRTAAHVREAAALYDPSFDMVVSVAEAKSNPYFTCFEEDCNGLLHHSKGNGDYSRRQDCPPVYEYNGAIYIINPLSLKQMPLSKFTRVRKYVMDAADSLDLDTPLDWKMAEMMLAEGLIKL